ncbi:MAG: sigma 54-interacting transcriptional regulator [Planctomycetota bacterium]|jgi:two-component system response regulator PilR (NtrC family)
MKQVDILRKQIREELSGSPDDPVAYVKKIFYPAFEGGKLEELMKASRREVRSQKKIQNKALIGLLIARIYREKGDIKNTERESLRISENNNLSPSMRATAYVMIALSCYENADFARAESFGKMALGLLAEGSGSIFALIQNTLGMVYLSQNRLSLALEYFCSAKSVYDSMKDPEQAFDATHNIALTMMQMGRGIEAKDRFIESLEIARKLGDQTFVAYFLVNFAEYLLREKDYKPALKHLDEAGKLLENLDDPRLRAFYSLRRGRALFMLGNADEARKYVDNAISIGEELKMVALLAEAHAMLGRIYASQDNPLAELHLLKSIRQYESGAVKAESGNVEYVLLEYGELLLNRNDYEGQKYVLKALEIIEKKPKRGHIRRAMIKAEELLGNVPEEYRQTAAKGVEVSRDDLKRILELSKAINSETELSGALDLMIEAAISISGAERGLVAISGNNGLEFAAVRNFVEGLESDEIAGVVRNTAGHSISTGKEFIAQNTGDSDELIEIAGKPVQNIKSILVFPLRAENRITGAVYLDSRFAVLEISPDIKDLLLAIVEQGATIIEKLEKYNRVVSQSNRLERKVRRQDIRLKETIDSLEEVQKELEKRYSYRNIIGRSLEMQKIFELLDRIANSNLPVNIYGKSGTGKEVIAKAIHYNGPRHKKRFVAINCAAIPENLLETELFGYEKGAFTGAHGTKKGLFEVADGGTIMLDEIGDMGEAMQSRLLRVVEQNETRRVGGNKSIKIDVRIISASNRKLDDLVKEGKFREDLFYRLGVLNLTLPPLRERREDIPLLVEHFWEKIAHEPMVDDSGEKSEFMKLLCDYNWPGNVRELENEIYRVHSLGDGRVSASLISDHILGKGGQDIGSEEIYLTSVGLDLRKHLGEIEKQYIAAALEKVKGNRVKASKLLGISRPSLIDKIKKYGIVYREVSY